MNDDKNMDAADLIDLWGQESVSDFEKGRLNYINKIKQNILPKVSSLFDNQSLRNYSDRASNLIKLDCICNDEFNTRNNEQIANDILYNNNELQDYKTLLFAIFNQCEIERIKRVDDYKSRREEKLKNIFDDVKQGLINKSQNEIWSKIKAEFSLGTTVDIFLNARSDIDIIEEKMIELIKEDYLKTCEHALLEAERNIHSNVSNKIYLTHSNDVKEVLNRKFERRFDYKEWDLYKIKVVNDLFGKPYVDYLISILSEKDFSESIYYWAEYEMYDLLNSNAHNIYNLSKEGFPEIEIIRFKAQCYFNKDSNDTKYINEQLSINADTYFRFCLQVWYDKVDRIRMIEENRQEQIDQSYYDNFSRNCSLDKYSDYGGPTDGYGGNLTDDFIDDALGGEYGAILNID